MDPSGVESTAFLLKRVREGDGSAQERLFRRFLPKLQRWARGRLPLSARALNETDDLVQATLLKAFKRIQVFEHRGEGAFLAYLRQILINELRTVASKKSTVGLRADEDLPDQRPSPSQDYLSTEAREKYEAGLATLSPSEREAIVLRLEFEYSYSEIAEAINKPSADAARMYVTRAIQRLARKMPQ